MVVRNTSSLKKKLGDILVEVGIITPDQLKQAVEIQRTQGGKLGDILKQLNFCSEDVLLAFLGRQCGASYISLTEYGQIPSDVINLVPESVVRHQSLIPISREGNVLTIAMSDPLNIFATDDLKLLTGCEIKVVIASEKEIESAIETYYISGLAPAAPAQAPSAASFGESGTLPAGTSMQDIVKSLEPAAGSVDVQQVETEPETSNAYQLKLESEDAPVVKMVNLLLANAVKNRASDIHIECYESSFRVRYRLDGVLCNQPAPPKKYQNAIASRIKVMANLDVAERRLPQDGRMKIRVDGTEVNLRISTMPTVHGEKVVVRLLDAAKLKVDLTGLGFDTNSLDVYRKAIHSPQGIILITGPTGSGKSTTIYSTLSDLNCMDRNIITIEDPVEYQLDGINQVQTHQEIGLTFASGLRTFLRQDPDIILVGEIRDRETAEIAINAALTGRLVFSTLHTNDATGTIIRLKNMGIEPFLITSTLIMSVAQRLLRLICEKCMESYAIPVEQLAAVGANAEQLRGAGTSKTVSIRRGGGCGDCANTGYRGRVAVYEIMLINNPIREAVLAGASQDSIKRMARENGMTTLREGALQKMLLGMTTLEEVLRVTQADSNE